MHTTGVTRAAPTAPVARIAAHRLAAQQLEASTCGAPADVVSRLVAIQAQDPAAARWAVGIRMPEGAVTERAVAEALANGSILRTHVMRWTWQLVSPADVRWLLALVAPRLLQRYAGRQRELGLDRAVLVRSRDTLERALAGGEHLTRPELAGALARARLPSTGPALSHLLAHAELQAVLCSGAPRGKAATYALLDLRAPRARSPLPRAEALAELARRYFESRGPATVTDLAWWAGLTVAEASAGLAEARSHLIAEEVGGMTWWRGPPAPGARRARTRRRALLLPAFDEYLVAYRDRRAMLDEAQAKRLNAGGGVLAPSVVVGGRVVGTWRRTLGRRGVEVQVALFEPLAARARAAVVAATSRYEAFLALGARRA